MRNTSVHAQLILEPQVEFSAAQVRGLKDFFADFFNRPAKANDAKALANETIAAILELELELAELLGQKEQYPFLFVLDGVLAKLKDAAGKNASWFLTELHREGDALLDIKEQLIEPLQKFMNSPQKAIYDAARHLVLEQEDNFAYVPDAEVAPIKALLTDPQPYKGNRLLQIKPQLDAMQKSIAIQLASEKAQAASKLDELELRLRGAAEYGKLSADQQTRLTTPFAQGKQALQGQKRIAMIRDQLRHFEEQRYPHLLVSLEQMASPAPVIVQPPDPAPGNSDGAYTATPVEPVCVVETSLIPARTISVNYAKPWLASEADLDDYLQQLRAAWLKEIRDGKRVQI